MPVISIFGGSPAVRRQAEDLIRELARGQPDILRANCCASFPDFPSSADGNPRRILPPAQEGPGSAELASEVRECFPDHRFVRFSDLDFALFSYRPEADDFNFLPLTEEKPRKALRNCMHQLRPRVPARADPAEEHGTSLV